MHFTVRLRGCRTGTPNLDSLDLPRQLAGCGTSRLQTNQSGGDYLLCIVKQRPSPHAFFDPPDSVK